MIGGIVLLLMGVILTLLLSTMTKRYMWIPLISTLATFLLILLQYPQTLGGTITNIIWKAPPYGILIQVDALNGLIALILTFSALMITLHATEYHRRPRYRAFFFSLLLLMFTGLLGMTITGDLFNIYVFFEIASLASYGLVAYVKNKNAIFAASKYLLIGSLGSTFVLLGIALLYAQTQTLNLADMATKIGSGQLQLFAMVLIFSGFAIKAGIVPFHLWKPSAIQATTPPVGGAIAGLSGMVGVYVIARLFYLLFSAYVINFSYILLILGMLTMIVGALMAIRETNLKKIFAFSGISQVGYVLMGFSFLTFWGFYGGIFHLINLALAKVIIFIAIGSVVIQTGKEDIEHLSGLARRLPITAGAFLIGCLATAGIPPTNGFMSKIFLYQAAFNAGRPIIGIVSIIVSAVTLAYFLKIFITIFFGPETKIIKEIRFPTLFALLLLSFVIILLGLSPTAIDTMITPAVEALLKVSTYVGVLG